jgi:hypothetical protein
VHMLSEFVLVLHRKSFSYVYIQRFTQMICAESKIKLGFAKTHFKRLRALYLVQNADGLRPGKLNPQ